MSVIHRIKALAVAGAIRLTRHARRELVNDVFTFDDLLAALDSARLLEEYANDPRGASCLICGRAKDQRPLHAVCTTATRDLVVVTVYEPKPPKWATPTQRGPKP